MTLMVTLLFLDMIGYKISSEYMLCVGIIIRTFGKSWIKLPAITML